MNPLRTEIHLVPSIGITPLRLMIVFGFLSAALNACDKARAQHVMMPDIRIELWQDAENFTRLEEAALTLYTVQGFGEKAETSKKLMDLKTQGEKSVTLRKLQTGSYRLSFAKSTLESLDFIVISAPEGAGTLITANIACANSTCSHVWQVSSFMRNKELRIF